MFIQYSTPGRQPTLQSVHLTPTHISIQALSVYPVFIDQIPGLWTERCCQLHKMFKGSETASSLDFGVPFWTHKKKKRPEEEGGESAVEEKSERHATACPVLL